MRKIYLILFLVSSLNVYSQKSFEVNLFTRYDKYAAYSFPFSDRAYADTVTLAGRSYGANLTFYKPLARDFRIYVGAGFYRLRVNDITTANRFGVRNSRVIDYGVPEGDILVSTNRYHYNNINFISGFSYERRWINALRINLSADLNIRYTYSQKYRQTFLNYAVLTNNERWFGYGVNFYAGLKNQIKGSKYYVNPKLIIPVFNRIKKDRAFTENESINMDKWFSGFGVALAIGRNFR